MGESIAPGTGSIFYLTDKNGEMTKFEGVIVSDHIVDYGARADEKVTLRSSGVKTEYSFNLSFDLKDDESETIVDKLVKMIQMEETKRFHQAVLEAAVHKMGLRILIYDYRTEYYLIPGQDGKVETYFMKEATDGNRTEVSNFT